MSRVLVSVTGSAGDLFPIIPIVLRLKAEGHDVQCAVSRPLSLYMRHLSLPVHCLDQARIAETIRRPAPLTTRFDGWESVRHLVDPFLAGSLSDQVASLERLTSGWAPDLVVASSFAAPARIVAHRRGIPQRTVSIYPQVARLQYATKFGRRFRRLCLDLAGLPAHDVDSPIVGDLAWGVSETTIWLHEAALLRSAAGVGVTALPSQRVVGFPYWDEGLRQTAEEEAIRRWLARSRTPAVMVTMGSHLGASQSALWRLIAETVQGLGIRGVYLGPRRAIEEALADCDGDWYIARFIRLSQIAGAVSAVVHHGGVGTMFGVIRAGKPAVVLPLAYDQTFNARMVEAAGVGLQVGAKTLHASLDRLLADPSFEDRCQALSTELTPAASAALRAVEELR